MGKNALHRLAILSPFLRPKNDAETKNDSPSLSCAPKKAAVNAPQSRRFPRFVHAWQSGSVWNARVFSTAFRRGTTVRQIQSREFQEDGERFSFSLGVKAGMRFSRNHTSRVDT